MQNPFQNKQSLRIADINEAYASDNISKEQYDDLVYDESQVSRALQWKYMALALFLGTIGTLFLLGL